MTYIQLWLGDLLIVRWRLHKSSTYSNSRIFSQVYRAHLVWDHDWRVTAVPWLTLLATFGASCVSLSATIDSSKTESSSAVHCGDVPRHSPSQRRALSRCCTKRNHKWAPRIPSRVTAFRVLSGGTASFLAAERYTHSHGLHNFRVRGDVPRRAPHLHCPFSAQAFCRNLSVRLLQLSTTP